MGLVARVLEAEGLSTICLSMMPELTARTGAPRVAGLEHPFGRPVGDVGDHATQRAVLRAALLALAAAPGPGSVVHLPFTWHEPPRKTRVVPRVPPPIAKACMRRPWLVLRLIRGDVPASAGFMKAVPEAEGDRPPERPPSGSGERPPSP